MKDNHRDRDRPRLPPPRAPEHARRCDLCGAEIDSYARPGHGFNIYCTPGCRRYGILA